MSVPFMWVDGNLTVILKNKAHQVIPDHTNYKLILEALPTATEDELLELVDIEKAVASFSDGQVSIVNGKVMFEGEEVHGSISKRIIEFMSKGLPFEPLVKFLQNLMENPSMQSQQELYDFLEHENLPITEDGCFLAYKAVNSDFKDKWKGTFDNKVGQVCEMRRAKVDDNRKVGCSQGLHAGALNYVANYGNVDAGDNIVIVKINPEDVVSVPSDCNCEKLRTCKYEVVGLYQGELPKPLYKAEFEADSYVDDEEYQTVYDEYNEDYWDQFEDDDDEDNYDEF
tara:strand:+ start:4378 stop:5229 length:852 start_codon:yes stop_codon:yes gene_type:complete